MTNVPGSCLARGIAFIWYGLVLPLWLGLVGFSTEYFHKLEKLNYEGLPKRSGHTAVITGGARGIGLVVIKNLLRLDYHVVLGVRNIDAGNKAIENIRKSGVISGSAQCIRLDLKSLQSVRSFANDVLQQTEQIHLLINNAGIMFEPYELTEDKYESQFQVNYLSHFLLTNLLLPRIKSTGAKYNSKCRIINISSVAHRASSMKNAKNLANPELYSAFRQYYDSKLCQILSAKYLNAQLKSENAMVEIFALHPGVIPTELHNSITLGRMTRVLKMFFRTVEDAAEVVMFTVLSPSLEGKGGSYISSKEIAYVNPIAEDFSLQKQLWDVSIALTSTKEKQRTC